MRDLATKCCEANGKTLESLHENDNLWKTAAYPPSRLAMPVGTLQTIRELFQSSWFSRLWVVQELMHAKTAVVYWGDMFISWDIVGLTATYVQSWSHVLNNEIMTSATYNCYMMRYRDRYEHFTVPQSLEYSSQFHCSTLVDRVYALLWLPCFNKNGFSIKTDYNRTQDQVFLDVTHECMRTDKTLEILSYIRYTQEPHLRKPSWVPQWDFGSTSYTIGYKRTTWTWCATRGKEIQITIDFQNSILNVKGFALDIIENHEQLSNTRWFPLKSTQDHPILQIWKQHYKNPWNYPSGEAAIDVLGGIFVAGIPYQERNCCTWQEIVRKGFSAYITHCAEDADEDTNEDVWKELYRKGGGGDWKGYELVGMNFCFQRSIFTTKDGWTGLGPNTLQENDVVVLLFGGDVAYILRSREQGGYILVGEAYVHGVMLGELMAKVNSGEYKEKIFEVH